MRHRGFHRDRVRFDEDHVHQGRIALSSRACCEIVVGLRRAGVISFGISFEATEMMPLPPSASSGRGDDVVAGQDVEVRREDHGYAPSARCCRTLP